MSQPTKVPIIVGVGEIKNASRKREDAVEPLHLMIQAIQVAAQDADAAGAGPGKSKSKVIEQIQSVAVIASSTWPALAGSSPVELVDDTAQLIAKGEIDVGVAVGGEAMASLKEFIKTDTYPPPWTSSSEVGDKVYYANDIDSLEGIGKIHRIGVPMQVYAMYENGLRARRGQTIAANHQESGSLYARFARIAAENPMAWNYGNEPKNEKTITTVNERNRMICFPYPLLMNAFNDVNLAAACILTSTDYAERMGIPREKWIFPLGAGRANDSKGFWNRPNFHSSRALSTALDMSLETSGLDQNQIDIFDFYSCFPIVAKLACQHLAISLETSSRPITLLGGLNSFGGAGANYSMHALAEMVRRLRKMRLSNSQQANNGLILANGGVLTSENAICLSTHEKRGQFSSYPIYKNNCSIQSNSDWDDAPSVSSGIVGEATVETYTVEYNRQNNPILGHIVCRLKQNGHRVIANHADDDTLKELSSWTEEPIGRSGYVRPSEFTAGQNLFTFKKEYRL